MMSQEFIDLRQQMYHTHVAYLRALATLKAVQVGGKRTDVVQRARELCQLMGGELDAALTALIDYLEPLQRDPPWDAEMHRNHKLHETLRRELALLQTGEDV